MNKAYQDYIKLCRANGVPLTTYNCPACQAEIETLRNDTDEQWDTQAFCPECDVVHMKLTAPNGDGAVGVTR